MNTPYLSIIVIFVAIVIWERYRKLHRKIELKNTPVLMSFYTDSMNLLLAKKGILANMDYQAFITLPAARNAATPVSNNALLYRVELPFRSGVHLLGIPRHSGTAPIDPTYPGSIMETVTLEGNYDKHFKLYAEKNMQITTRYIVDPADMVFTIDFCKSHCWEIIDDELYFVQEFGAGDKNDPTFMFNDIEEFINGIRPAKFIPATHKKSSLSSKKSSVKKHPIEGSLYKLLNSEAAARRAGKDIFNCPKCSNRLDPDYQYYKCPNSHGILLKGFALPLVKQGEIPNSSNYLSKLNTTEIIACPACNADMSKVSYAGSNTTIDSCTNCPYRWLDRGELAPI